MKIREMVSDADLEKVKKMFRQYFEWITDDFWDQHELSGYRIRTG